MLARVRRRLTTLTLAATTPTVKRRDLVRLGSTYGGWWVPADLLDDKSICYLGGVGEDVSFDLAMIATFGCTVHAFDPTPRAALHVQNISDGRFRFVPIGLWKTDETVKFFEPTNPAHVSYSITNIQRTDGYFSAPCQTINSVMLEHGHSHLDLLKLDIEGAEAAVISDLLVNGPLPRVLCVELDAVEPVWTTLRRLSQLRRSGYVCNYIEGRNYTFTRCEAA